VSPSADNAGCQLCHANANGGSPWNAYGWGAKRIHARDNRIVSNNRPNTARPGSILATVPSGTGVLYVGVDESEIARNHVEDNAFAGIALVDYCLAVLGTEFSCSVDPNVTREFGRDKSATNNRVIDNTLIGNGTHPDPEHPFASAAADLGLLTVLPNGNCFPGNVFSTFFSVPGGLPACP
jgi:hypothetical protein